MALTKMTGSVNNVQGLDDQVVGQASNVKQTLDKAGTDIKTYINDVLTVEIDESIAEINDFLAEQFAEPAPSTAAMAISAYNGTNPEFVAFKSDNVSVKNFGADKTGILDSTAAFTNAIAAATLVGGYVTAPKGTYKLNNVVEFTCPFICNGGVILMANRLTIAANNVTLRGFKVISNNNTAVSCVGTYENVIQDSHLDNVDVSFVGSTSEWLGINSSYTQNLKVTNCKFYKGGIQVDNATDFEFTQNYFNGEFVNTNEMCHVSVHSRGIITGNSFKNLNFEAIDIFSSGERCIITNNRIENYYNHAIDIKVVIRDSPYTGGSSDQPEYGYAEKSIVSGNVIHNLIPQANGRYYGITCSWVDDRSVKIADITKTQAGIIISNNVISDMFTSNPLSLTDIYCSGILVVGTCINVTNNAITNIQQQSQNHWDTCGIQLGGSSANQMYAYGCNIIGNIISTDASGIQIWDARNCNINDNLIKKDERNNLTCRYGIRISVKLEYSNIEGNNIEVLASTGMAIIDISGSTASYLNVLGNVFINGGVYFNNSSVNHSSFNNNIFNNATLGLVSSSPALQNTANGNKFKNTTSDYPINFDTQKGFIIISNSFDTCNAGILIQDTSTYGLIIGNTAKSNSYATVVRYLNVSESDLTTITEDHNIKYA